MIWIPKGNYFKSINCCWDFELQKENTSSNVIFVLF